MRYHFFVSGMHRASQRVLNYSRFTPSFVRLTSVSFASKVEVDVSDRRSIKEEREQRLGSFVDENKELGNSSALLYPSLPCKPTHTIQEYRTQYDHILTKGEERAGEEAIVCGRIYTKRHASKKLIFLDIGSDGSNVQIMASLSNYKPSERSISFNHLNSTVNRGDIIMVKGIPKKTNVGELSIIPKEMFLLAPCYHGIPAYHGLKDVEPVRERFLLRSKIISFLRRSLEDEDFVEVETPTLWSDAGGANATPFQTTLKALDENIPLYLRVAPELFLKMLVIGGMERVFEIGKQYRNEGIDATHNPEFTSCEFYRAYADYTYMQEFMEKLLSGLAQKLNQSSTVMLPSGREADFSAPFRKIEIMPTLQEKIGEPLPDPNTDDSSAWDALCKRLNVPCSSPRTTARLLDKLIGHYLEPECVNPTFLINHPKILSPLAKQHPTLPGITERFELFVDGMELSNGYSELNDPKEQSMRFQSQMNARKQGDTEAQPSNTDFIEALEHGLPPTSGCGIGIDRMVMLFTEMQQIRVI